MKNAREYFEKRKICRDLNVKGIGVSMLEILRAKTTDEEKKRIEDNKVNASLGKPLSNLYDIKDKYCLSWNELRVLVIRF